MAVKFTEKAEKVLQIAKSEAKRLGHGYVGPEHLLWALLHQPVWAESLETQQLRLWKLLTHHMQSAALNWRANKL